MDGAARLSVHFRVQSKASTAAPRGLTIFILAGGKSTRMGREKWRLPLGNRNFLERITETARETGAPVHAIFEDDEPGVGPLGGVATALRRFPCRQALFLSCDMPLITEEFLWKIIRAGEKNKAVFTEDHGPGFPFLLPRAAEPQLTRLLKSGGRSLHAFAETSQAQLIQPSEDERLFLLNVNTPSEYKAAADFWARRQSSDAVLEVRRLTIRRGHTDLLRDFSWKVRSNEHWVILGPNGCGKTSLFSALLGYLTPTRGDVFVLGQEYGNADWPELRKKVGVVSSSVRQMMPDAEPAWITVASGKYAMIDFWGTPNRRDRSASLKILRDVEAEYLSDREWACLSQGERQRVLIGRALMGSPALLVLDEPCAGLDPAAREHFLQFLQRLGRTPKSPSLVLVTHHVEEIMPVFTHALLMKAGGKLAEGRVSEMLRSDLLSKAFDTVVRVRRHEGRHALNVKSKAGVVI